MNVLKHNGYMARVEFDDEDEIFVGRLAGINDIISFHADTVSDLKAAFHEAVADYIATCAKAGKSLAGWTEEKLREAATREIEAA